MREADKDFVRSAMEKIEEETCLRFKEQEGICTHNALIQGGIVIALVRLVTTTRSAEETSPLGENTRPRLVLGWEQKIQVMICINS